MKKSVLYVGQAFYNHWYLSRELRKLGWQTELINISHFDHNNNFYHGEDIAFNSIEFKPFSKRVELFVNALYNYQIFHFANTRGIYFFNEFSECSLRESKKSNLLSKVFFKAAKMLLAKNKSNLYRILYLIGPKRFSGLILKFKGYFPPRWDIFLIKYFKIKIFYTNNGCQDGATKTGFGNWKTPTDESVCDICAWTNDPKVCSDQRNTEWGEFRNSVVDYHANIGCNKVDFNTSEHTFENPWVYCLDKNFWSPAQLIPTNFKLNIPSSKVKVLHAVGNYDSRSSKGNRTIKSTHIYVPLIEKLKNNGHNVELIFFKDIPNKSFKYYQLQADIVVDMLSFGFFGANIREAMMLGKVCVCYLRPSWLEEMRKEIPNYVDELPVVSANENDIEEVLIDLISNSDKRKEIGRKSREFAVKWHASDAAAQKFDKLYQEYLD